MTREEAIEILEKYKIESEEDYYVKRAEALDIAIKALEQEPCGDAISRQAVEDAIKKAQYSRDFCKEHHIDYSISMEMVRIVLHDLPHVKPEQKWIPCSERLPEKPDNYPYCEIRRTYFLVSLASGCVKALGYEFDRDEWQITGSPVVAWMPLPEPYKEGEQE